jgi:hypothetical protein
VHPATHVLNIRQAAAIAVVLFSPSTARIDSPTLLSVHLSLNGRPPGGRATCRYGDGSDKSWSRVAYSRGERKMPLFQPVTGWNRGIKGKD